MRHFSLAARSQNASLCAWRKAWSSRGAHEAAGIHRGNGGYRSAELCSARVRADQPSVARRKADRQMNEFLMPLLFAVKRLI